MSFDYLPHRLTRPMPKDPAAVPDAIAVSDHTLGDTDHVRAAREFVARLNANRAKQGNTTP